MSQPPPLTIRIKPSSYNGKPATPETMAQIEPGSTLVEISINNVVSSFSTSCRLNLRTIAMSGMHVEYKKENNMVNMRLRRPLTTASIWHSGKITCTGATTEPDAYRASRRFCRLLQRMKFKVRLYNYRVVNVLATCAMPFAVDIYRVAGAHQKECSYEPELHPGATFKIKDLHATLKLFNTGSITLTAPCVKKIEQAIEAIYPILWEFRRDTSPTPAVTINNPVLTHIVKLAPVSHGYNGLTINGGNNSNIAYAVQNCSREFKTESYTAGFSSHVIMTGGMAANNQNTITTNTPLITTSTNNNGSFQYDLQLNSAYTNSLYTTNHSFNMFESQLASSSTMTPPGSGLSSASFDYSNGYLTHQTIGYTTNGSSHLMGSPTTSGSSAGLFGGVGGVTTPVSSASQPYHWFNDTSAPLAVDNMFDDFLP